MKNYVKHVDRDESGRITKQAFVVFDDADPVERKAAILAVTDAPGRSVFRAFPGYSGPVVGQGGGF